MRHRDCEDRETLGDVLLELGREVRCCLRVFRDELLEESLGFRTIRRVENSSKLAGDRLANFQSRRMVRRVALKVDLATLPGYAGKDSIQSRFNPGVIVSRDKLQAAEAAVSKRREKLAPVNLRFRETDTDSENRSHAVSDADGDEDGDGDHLAAVANLLVAGVENEILVLGEWTRAPLLRAPRPFPSRCSQPRSQRVSDASRPCRRAALRTSATGAHDPPARKNRQGSATLEVASHNSKRVP